MNARLIGINSAITRGEEGDSSFGFAIADTELAAFLRGLIRCCHLFLRRFADADAHVLRRTLAPDLQVGAVAGFHLSDDARHVGRIIHV